MSKEIRDIILDIEAAYKEAVDLLYKVSISRFNGKMPMRYQRYKILREVVNGKTLTEDIAYAAGSSPSTSSAILMKLKETGHITRSRVNWRTFEWTPTKLGKEECKIMSDTLQEITGEISLIAKGRIASWIKN